MNIYAEIAEWFPTAEVAPSMMEGRIEAARKQMASYWPVVNPGAERVETISEETRLLGNGRREKIVVIKWSAADG